MTGIKSLKQAAIGFATFISLSAGFTAGATDLQCYFSIQNRVSPLKGQVHGSVTVYRANDLGYWIELVVDPTSYFMRADLPDQNTVEVSGELSWIPVSGRDLMTFPKDRGVVRCSAL